MEKHKVKMKGQELSVRGPRLNVGQQAPDFRLVDNEFNPKTLGDFGRQVKLVSIVPSLDTGVCDAQTRRFNEELSGLPGAVAITVSVDLPFAQKRWCGAAGLEQRLPSPTTTMSPSARPTVCSLRSCACWPGLFWSWIRTTLSATPSTWKRSPPIPTTRRR